MAVFYKASLEDILEFQKTCTSQASSYNEFIRKHHYYQCSCCGKTELYDRSPVLEDDMWETCCEKLGLKELNESTSKKLTFKDLGYWNSDGLKNDEQKRAYVFYKAIEQLSNVRNDGEYCMLCRECVEKALGRPLKKSDLPHCSMNDNLLKEYED